MLFTRMDYWTLRRQPAEVVTRLIARMEAARPAQSGDAPDEWFDGGEE